MLRNSTTVPVPIMVSDRENLGVLAVKKRHRLLFAHQNLSNTSVWEISPKYFLLLNNFSILVNTVKKIYGFSSVYDVYLYASRSDLSSMSKVRSVYHLFPNNLKNFPGNLFSNNKEKLSLGQGEAVGKYFRATFPRTFELSARDLLLRGCIYTYYLACYSQTQFPSGFLDP